MDIRIATTQDAAAIQSIYAPYVENTAITFEVEAPAVSEIQRRISEVTKRYPWIVAEHENQIIGYAYAGTFKPRASYDWSVELSVYVDRNARGRGIGRSLYDELTHLLTMQNIQNINACIAYAPVPDEYLTDASVKFHEKLGFRMVGIFQSCANKFGRWYDMCWMEKHIGEHGENPEPFIPFSQLQLA